MHTIIDALKTPKRFEIIPAIDWMNAEPFPVDVVGMDRNVLRTQG